MFPLVLIGKLYSSTEQSGSSLKIQVCIIFGLLLKLEVFGLRL